MRNRVSWLVVLLGTLLLVACAPGGPGTRAAPAVSSVAASPVVASPPGTGSTPAAGGPSIQAPTPATAPVATPSSAATTVAAPAAVPSATSAPRPGLPGASTPDQAAAVAPTSVPTGVASPAPTPTAALPPYAIEALRRRKAVGSGVTIGGVLWSGPGFTASRLTWTSEGSTMTGTISIPAGRGPFPVVLVDHGYVAPSQYWVGQDSRRYGDPLASHGFVVVAPDYPSHAGSGPPPPNVPQSVGITMTVLDLIASLRTLPQADTARLAVLGHSQGGEIAMLTAAIEPSVKAVVLFAPDSSDMADNARMWGAGHTGSLGGSLASPQTYALFSPRAYFRVGDPPVLLVQGTTDEEIPAAWTQATYQALQRAGVQTKFISVPGARHIFEGADLASANAAAEAWIRQALRS